MDTGFFKWVWRFNAVLIFLGALLIVCLILWEITRDLRRHGQQVDAGGPFASASTENTNGHEPKLALRFGTPSAGTASGLYALPLNTKQSYNSRSVSKSNSGTLINYMIVNTTTESRKWLFPNADRRILHTRPLVFHNNDTDIQLGHILGVIETDTNGDDRLSRLDTQTIYFTDSHWGEPLKIRDGVTAILATEAVSKDAFDLIFTAQNTTHALRIDAPTARIISEQSFSTQD
jgi:hypothetical protein